MKAGSILPPLLALALGSMLAAPVPTRAADELASATLLPAHDTNRFSELRAPNAEVAMGKDLA